SALEIAEITGVLRHLLKIQKVLLQVNRQYILSASQDDAYRTEPRFQLQGSYRNMNKLAEKVVPVMNEAELEALLDDHYAGEAQTLTSGAEHNLLKLAELRGRMTPQQAARWEEIKRGFARVQLLGGAAESDPVARVTGQLSLLSERMGDIARTIETAGKNGARVEEPVEEPEVAETATLTHHVVEHLGQLGARLDRIGELLARPPHPAPVPAPPPVTVAAPPAADLSPYLEKLDRTLAT
ncbi:MAG TPA: DNA repair protein, partial [Acidobacteria bacterium]|nr:DNA repair protein [Acidobacteriota bacterium]